MEKIEPGLQLFSCRASRPQTREASKMATIRAVNYLDERLATGRTLKSGVFLQFYPRRVEFASEDVWKYTLQSQDPTIDFTDCEYVDKVSAADRCRQERLQAQVLGYLKDKIKPTLDTKQWSYHKKQTHTFPPGTYYIGDLCYALPESIYDGVFGRQGYVNGFYGVADDPLNSFLVAGTAFGDGEYRDSMGQKYNVDAGIMGICPENLVDKTNPSRDGGQMHTFTYPVECRFDHGIFVFKQNGYTVLRIDTQGGYDESE
jgi:hypothetical protein